MQQIYTPPLTYTNKIIIIFASVLFFLSTIMNVYGELDLVQFMGLSPHMFFKGHIYQLVTYSFVQTGLLGAVFNCLIVWFIGGDLELSWGRTFYRKFLGLTILATGGFYLLVSFVFWGTGGTYTFLGLQSLCLALLVAYAMVNPDRHLTFMFLFPMKAKYFCMLLCVLEIYGVLVSAYAQSAWAHLFSIAFSFLYLRYLSGKAQGKPFIPKGLFKRPSKKKPKLSIVKDRDDDPKYWH